MSLELTAWYAAVFRNGSRYRTHFITAKRMISSDVLKYRKMRGLLMP